MPDEIVQHCDFDRGGSRREIADPKRIVSEDYQDSRLHPEAEYADRIEPDEVDHR